jgi:hypothetical protein
MCNFILYFIQKTAYFCTKIHKNDKKLQGIRVFLTQNAKCCAILQKVCKEFCPILAGFACRNAAGYFAEKILCGVPMILQIKIFLRSANLIYYDIPTF